MENTRDFTRHLNSLLDSIEQIKPEQQEIIEWLDSIRKKEPGQDSKNLYATYEKMDTLKGILEAIQPMITDLKVNGDRSKYALRPMPVIPEVYKRKEAAEKLGMSPRTLTRKINDNIIHTTVDGKISEAEIYRYLAG